jgi:hypothetical protein
VASIPLLVPGLPDLAAAALSGALFLGTGQLIGMVPGEVYHALAPSLSALRLLARRGGA